MNSSKAFVLLIILLNVVPGLCQTEWVEISIDLRRSIGSAGDVSAYLGGTYEGMLKAFVQVPPGHGDSFARYYVYFFASFPGGEIRMCKGIVLWRFPSFERITELARCGL